MSEERVEKLSKLWLIMILRLGDPKLEACRKVKGGTEIKCYNSSPVYCISAAAWSMAVVENATMLGVEVAVETTFIRG